MVPPNEYRDCIHSGGRVWSGGRGGGDLRRLPLPLAIVYLYIVPGAWLKACPHDTVKQK